MEEATLQAIMEKLNEMQVQMHGGQVAEVGGFWNRG